MPNRDRVLLIGGNGFLGRALADALAAEDREVNVVSRHAEPGYRSGIVFHRASQDDPSVVPPLLEVCDTVVHLASTTTPGSSARNPTMDTQENVLPAAELINFLSNVPPRRLLFISSGGAIYGDPVRIPVDENAQANPFSYHAAGKLALESLFRAFAHANETSLAIVRPSNLYGPGQPLRHGFGLVRTLMDRTLHGAPVEVWGDGDSVRDYLFIDDAVRACLTLLDHQPAAGIFNVSSAIGTSIREMIGLVEKVTQHRLAVVKRSARSTDVRDVVLDHRRLTKETGWTPQIELEEGLRRTWAWLRSTK